MYRHRAKSPAPPQESPPYRFCPIPLWTSRQSRITIVWHGRRSPERFDNAETAQRPSFSWFPFGGGPRLCLGFKFAEVESLIALARVYQKYDLALIPGQQIQPEPIITLRPDRPMLFRVTERKRASPEAATRSPNQELQHPSTCPFATTV